MIYHTSSGPCYSLPALTCVSILLAKCIDLPRTARPGSQTTKSSQAASSSDNAAAGAGSGSQNGDSEGSAQRQQWDYHDGWVHDEWLDESIRKAWRDWKVSVSGSATQVRKVCTSYAGAYSLVSWTIAFSSLRACCVTVGGGPLQCLRSHSARCPSWMHRQKTGKCES